MDHRALTILFVDMKGFTSRTSGQSRTETAELVGQLQTLLAPPAVERGGRLVKTIGDALLLTFESPTDAALAGVAIQEALERHNASVGSAQRFDVRMAINTGEVIVTADDVYGEAVNIAARLQELAAPNEILLAESTFLAMNKSEVPTQEVGTRALRGIPRKVTVFRVAQPHEAASNATVRWVGGVIAVGVVGVAALVGWSMVHRPAPPLPAAPAVLEEPVALPEPEPVIIEEVVSPEEPSPEAVAAAQAAEAVAQQVAALEAWLQFLNADATDVEQQLESAWRELGEVQVRLGRLEGQANEFGRSLPIVRQQHRDQINRVIEKSTTDGDQYTVGYLSADLNQYEAKVAEWEGGLPARAAALQASKEAARQWEPLLSDWVKQVRAVLLELPQRSGEMAQLNTLTTWDAPLDAMNATLDSIAQRLAPLRASIDSVRNEVALRQQEIGEAETYLAAWEEFREQWRAYVAGLRSS